MTDRAVTLAQFVLQQERDHPEASGEFTQRAAGHRAGRQDDQQGGHPRRARWTCSAPPARPTCRARRVQKLDVFAHDTIMKRARLDRAAGGGRVRGGRGHRPDARRRADRQVRRELRSARRLVEHRRERQHRDDLLDPAAHLAQGPRHASRTACRPAAASCAPATCCTAPRTMLVYTTGDGVHGFTYEPSIGEFLLSHPNIRTPARGRIYSVNEGNYAHWSDGMKRYVDWLKCEDKTTGRPVQRALRRLAGGGFSPQPAVRRHLPVPRRPQESAAASCACSTSARRWRSSPSRPAARRATATAASWTSRPASLHQRSPLFLGSPEDVKDCESFLSGKHEGVSIERRS